MNGERGAVDLYVLVVQRLESVLETGARRGRGVRRLCYRAARLTRPYATQSRACPVRATIAAYFQREVLPHALDAWIDAEKSKVGYEIPFNRHFYVFEPPRDLHAIDEELKAVSANIMKMLGELAE